MPIDTMSAQQAEFDRINAMGREEMCHLWRNAPSGHLYFDTTKPYYEVFKARFDKLGGFSPAISKRIGWHRMGWITNDTGEGRNSRTRNYPQVVVEPCSKCKEREYDAGHAAGYKECEKDNEL